LFLFKIKHSSVTQNAAVLLLEDNRTSLIYTFQYPAARTEAELLYHLHKDRY